MDPETVLLQDRIADDGRRQIAESHPEHERPRERDTASAAIDGALDDARSTFGGEKKRGRAVKAIGHRRIEEPRTDDRHADAASLESRPKRLGIGSHPRLARTISGAVRKSAISGDR